ncbi:MAG: ABC transporter [Actinomycetales bacterium]|nr:MAG: ABC transporter [Actinomycetales bacterium]
MAFGSNEVLKGVTMSLTPGKVTALLGANGAGKSTLIKILAGVYTSTGGKVTMAGEEITITSPAVAAVHGIQTVHQRVGESIVPGLTVAENLCFEEIISGEIPAMRSLRALIPRAKTIAATLDLDWDEQFLRSDVFGLGIADTQLLLLARALVRHPEVLILDEPTSTLSMSEAERLFDVVRKLRSEGVAILYVSHHLSEINTIADELVVLRDGKIVAEQQQPFTMVDAVRAMLGEGVAASAELVEQRGTETALELSGVRVLKKSPTFDLVLRYGEVTGIIGLIGAGKSELARGIYGAEALLSGKMQLDGKPYRPRWVADAVRKGVYLVPEDRAEEAMLPQWSLERTASLPFLGRVSPGGVINRFKERAEASTLIDRFRVVATGPEQPMDAMSGGNQQKVIVGRWMNPETKVMLLDEPYRGVDIGARTDISAEARGLAESGACVVVFSSDIEEIRAVADRIVVMVEGRITLDSYATEVSNETILSSMSEVA